MAGKGRAQFINPLSCSSFRPEPRPVRSANFVLNVYKNL